MTNLEYKAARERLGLSNDEFARALGITWRQHMRFQAGTKGGETIPKPIERLIWFFYRYDVPKAWLRP